MANPRTIPTRGDEAPGDDPASTKPQKATRRDVERRGPTLRIEIRTVYSGIPEGREEENDRTRSPLAPSSIDHERYAPAAASG